jgi:hypothetical protein
MQRRDLGEIITGYRYVREVYSANKKDKGECLLSSEELFTKLIGIYDAFGIDPIEEDKMGIRVKLPNNQNPILRDWWHGTTIKKTGEQAVIIKIDRFAGYIEGEAVLATTRWMRSFESNPGDKVIISPCVPVPDLSYEVR